MTNNYNPIFQDSNPYKGKIAEIQTYQNLPTIIPGSLVTVKKVQLEEFKRKMAHENRISSQETKLEEQLNSDFVNLPAIQVSFNSGQSIKKMSLSDLEDSFENKVFTSPKKKLDKLSKTNKKSIVKQIKINKKNTALAFGLATMMVICGFTFNNLSNTQIKSTDKVANAAESITKSDLQIKMEAYSQWMKKLNNGQYIDPNTDSDKDTLTNYEEFVIGSNPLSAFSCNENINDSENLLNLINPSTCRGIDLQDPNDIKTFGDIVNLPLLQTQIGEKKSTIESSSSSASLLDSDNTNEKVLENIDN
jgi:hypothetical protein